MKTIEQIEARLSEISAELEKPEADLDALNTEVDSLKEEREKLVAQAKLREKVAGGTEGRKINTLLPTEPVQEKKHYDASSAEYRDAFFLHMAHRDGEMTEEQRAAFVETTSTGAILVPTTTVDEVYDMMAESHPILNDCFTLRSNTVVSIPIHKAIVAGDAKKVAEGAANDDEQNTWVNITLSGNDFSKSVDVSYKMAKMAISAFETYLTKEIADRLGSAMAQDAVDNAIEAKIDAENKKTAASATEFTYKEILSTFAELKRVDDAKVTVYCTRKTLMNYIAGLVDSNKRPIYNTNVAGAPLGTLLGATIKYEDAVAEGTMLVGDASKVVWNYVQEPMIEQDKDIKTHVYTYSGYACAEGILKDGKCFASLTKAAA